MLERLTINNFRSLNDETRLDLKSLNFFVGINGSGKSNLLKALTFVRDAVRMGLPGAVTRHHGIEALRRHSSGHPRNVRIDLSLRLEQRAASYGFEITGDRSEEYRVKEEWASGFDKDEKPWRFKTEKGKWIGPENLKPNIDPQSLALTALGGDPRIKPLRDFLAHMMVYSIFPDVLREPQKFSNETPMKSQGENWVSILHQQEKNAWKKELVAALTKLTGDIEDVKIARAGSFLVAQFRHKTAAKNAKKWFDATTESDGTLRVAGLITSLLQEPPLPVIGIEEPELTVHPGALPLILDFLREASRRSQILVTTHSPLLLDLLNLDEAGLFVVQKQEGATSVAPLSEAHKDTVRQDLMSLGDLMIPDGQIALPL